MRLTGSFMFSIISQFNYSIKQALVSLKKRPVFMLSVITTMGLTLGTLLCIVTLAYVMLFKPLPYPDQARLYKVEHLGTNAEGKQQQASFTYPGLINLHKTQAAFSDTALSFYFQRVLTSHINQPRLTTT